MAAWSCPSCGQYVSTGLSSCPRCRRPTPLPANGTSANPDAERLAMERYLLHQARTQQIRNDQQAFNRQRPSPLATWGNDRSVANNIVGSANTNDLPSIYPYPRTIDDRDMYATSGPEPVQQGPSYEAQQVLPYGQRRVSQYVPQQVPPSAPQQMQIQRPAGYDNGFSATNGLILRPTQDAQVERRQTEDTDRTETSATVVSMPSARRRERAYRGSYGQ